MLYNRITVKITTIYWVLEVFETPISSRRLDSNATFRVVSFGSVPRKISDLLSTDTSRNCYFAQLRESSIFSNKTIVSYHLGAENLFRTMEEALEE